MPDSYPFPIYSGLLESRHYKNIGTAIWFFLWCVSSSTSEVERNGERWGLVHGKKPLKLSQLAEPFGVNCKTISRWLEALEQHGYIQVTRAPYGLIIQVRKSKKFLERTDKNVRSEGNREQTNMSTLSNGERTNMSDLDGENGQKCLISPERTDKNVHSNKDIKDFTTTPTTDLEERTRESNNLPDELLADDIVPKGDNPFIQILDAYCELHTKLDFHVRDKERGIMRKFVSMGMPAKFVVDTMRKLYAAKKLREEDEDGGFSPPTSFAYYRDAIEDAWRVHNQPEAPPHEELPERSGRGERSNRSRKDRPPVLVPESLQEVATGQREVAVTIPDDEYESLLASMRTTQGGG